MPDKEEELLDAATQNYLKIKAEKYQAEKGEESEKSGESEQSSTATEITVSEEKVTEITDKIKGDNEGKSEEELKTLTDAALVTEKEKLTTEAHEASSAQVIQEKIAEVKGREGNKEKSEEEILTIATEEIRSLQVEGKPKPEAPEGTEGQKTIDEQLSAKTDGKYENIDELIAKAEEQPEEKVELSERVQKLHDLEKSGADVNKVLAFEALKIDDMDPADFETAKMLIKLEWKMADEAMTEADLNYDLSRGFELDYKYGEDDEEKEHPLNKEAVDNERRRVIREATKSKSRLLELKEKYLLPNPGANSQAAADVTRQKLADLTEKWNGKVETSFTGFEAINAKVGEETEFRYLLDAEKLASVKGVVTDPVTQFLGMYTKDGVTDIAQMQQDIAMIQNRDDYHSKLWEQAEASGQEKLVRRTSKLKTEPVPGGSSTNSEVKHKTPAHAMVEDFKKEIGMKE